MLTQLRIRDFAIVEELELELAAGMTARENSGQAGFVVRASACSSPAGPSILPWRAA